MPEEAPQHSHWLRRYWKPLAAIAATMVAGAAPGLKSNFAPGSDQSAGNIQMPMRQSLPTTTEESTRESAFLATEIAYEYGGYGATELTPSPREEETYSTAYLRYEDGLPVSSASPPRLRTVSYLLDSKAFPEKTNREFGLRIYDATEKPVDLRFVRYAAEALKLWVSLRDGKVVLDDGVRAQVKTSEKTYHDIFLVPHMPPNRRGLWHPHALTEQFKNGSLSWVAFGNNYPTSSSPPDAARLTTRNHPYIDLGVELCQALVRVSKPSALPFENGATQALESSRYNPYAHHDPKLAAQEMTCNSLGRIIAASYFNGLRGIRRLSERRNEQIGILHAHTFDYALANPQLADVLALRQQVLDSPDNIYTHL